MAEEGLIASQLVVGSDGNLRASVDQEFRTPAVIGPTAFFFALSLALAIGIGLWYWHALELAKQAHPDETGYGHWYFTKTFRIIFAIVGSIVLLLIWAVITILFFTVGSAETQAYIRGKEQASEDRTENALFQNVVAGANARTARFRQMQYGDQSGQELTAM